MRQSPRLTIAMLTVLTAIFLGNTMQAQFLVNPQPGDIFKEYPKYISSSNDDFRVTDPASPDPRAQGYLPNHTLSINISDMQGATRAEIIPDMWGGHAGTTGKKFRFNNNAWITIPEMGVANGIPAGHDGQCYVQQFNPTVAIPIGHLQQGNNTFQGTSGGQTCYNFNWGQWGWYGVVVRIYYSSSKPHATGSISSPSSGSTIGENPTVAATTSGGATSVDFLAYYNGYDFDGDGVTQQYHHGYHRLKTETSMVMKNHVGTDNSSPFSATWNTNLVPTQGAGSIKFLARIKDASGTYFVTNEVTNITLQRTGSVKMYKVTNVPERFWVRNGRTPRTVNFTIPAGDNLANATAATLVMSTWNGNDISENANTSIKVNSHTFADFGADHFWSFDAIAFPKTALRNGSNDIVVTANTAEHGIEGLWPGPVVIVRYSTGGGGGNTGPEITQHPANQSVTVGETATFTVQATGSATLTYQWQKNNSNISGATNPSYTTPPTVIGDNNSTYRCVVTNGFGNATSNAATLTVGVVSGPNITQHPANRTVTVGQTATFNVVATGTAPLTYQWYKNNVLIVGAISASYTTPPAALTDDGNQYHCIVTNLIDNATSNPATLTVNEAPPPGSNVINNPSFESGTTGWVFYTNGSGDFTSMPPGNDGANAARLNIVSIGNNMQLYQSGISLEPNTLYTLTFAAYSSSGNDLRMSLQRHDAPYTNYGLSNVPVNLTTGWQVVTLQFTTVGFSAAEAVNNGRLRFVLNGNAAAGDVYVIDNVVLQTGSGTPPPTITTHPANQTVAAGQQATFSVVASGSGLSYQWQRNTVDIPGANSASYTTPPTTIANNGEVFRCRVSNAGGPVNSNNATLTVTTSTVVNLLTNPGFESGTTAWNFHTNGAGSFIAEPPGLAGNNSGHVEITAQGTNVQLYQSGINLIANARYRITFSAYSPTGHDVALFVHQQGPPYTNYGLSNVLVDLSATWQTFVVPFTSRNFAGTVNDARLRFWMSPYDAPNDEYFFDNVMLELVPNEPAGSAGISGGQGINVTPTAFLLNENYPNPFNPTTTISYGVPEDASVLVEVYNLLGQMVVTLAEGVHQAGNYTVAWDGRDSEGNQLGSGIYFYRMNAVGGSGATFTSMKKMVLMK